MGTINDKIMVVIGCSDGMNAAHAKSCELFVDVMDDYGRTSLVSPLVASINGARTFTIATSGSKAGWGPAERHDEACRSLAKWLDAQEDLYAKWAILTWWEDTDQFECEWQGGHDDDGNARPYLNMRGHGGGR